MPHEVLGKIIFKNRGKVAENMKLNRKEERKAQEWTQVAGRSEGYGQPQLYRERKLCLYMRSHHEKEVGREKLTSSENIRTDFTENIARSESCKLQLIIPTKEIKRVCTKRRGMKTIGKFRTTHNVFAVPEPGDILRRRSCARSRKGQRGQSVMIK